MKTKIQIYKGDDLIVEQIVKSKKEEDEFLRNNFPKMTMTTRVREGWRIFRSDVKHGGSRKDAGRKPLKDKKVTVSLYILESKIKQYGGLEGIKLHLYNSIEG